MTRDRALEDLWDDASAVAGAPFSTAAIATLPQGARRYLTHAIADGTSRATAVRLRMHGTIKLGAWVPFEAEQVIRWPRGFVWRARAKLKGIVPVSGFDRWLEGEGASRWKLAGLVPVASGAGNDISRSALGRAQIETAIWLPSLLLDAGTTWRGDDATHATVRLALGGEPADVALTIAPSGAATSVVMQRWGDPDRRGFAFVPCGAFLDEESTFGGYTIPTKLRVGWHFGEERFARDGEFFRATIDDAQFR